VKWRRPFRDRQPNISAGWLKSTDSIFVAGLFERDRHLVYNTAVLLGPEGRLAGKYRKVCLPRGEVDAGVCPGTSIRC